MMTAIGRSLYSCFLIFVCGVFITEAGIPVVALLPLLPDFLQQVEL
jgi:hypothetical protein